MMSGSPCSRPPFSVNPHGAPPCSWTWMWWKDTSCSTVSMRCSGRDTRVLRWSRLSMRRRECPRFPSPLLHCGYPRVGEMESYFSLHRKKGSWVTRGGADGYKWVSFKSSVRSPKRGGLGRGSTVALCPVQNLQSLPAGTKFGLLRVACVYPKMWKL